MRLTCTQLAMPASAPEGTPVRVLRGFEKILLQPGESQTVDFPLTRRDLSYWDIMAQEWSLPTDGSIGIEVGWSSRDLLLNDTISWMVSG
jgi:beta-glucosidase